MSISSLVLHATPGKTDAVCAALAAVRGVEVHTSAADGRIVVTVDEPDDGDAADIMTGLRDIPDVLSVSLVYSHFDGISAGKEQADESNEA